MRRPGTSPVFAIAAVVVTLVFLGVGIALGYFFAIARSAGGFGGLAGLVALVWTAAASFLLIVVGVIALAFERTRPAGKISFMSAAAVLAGAISASLAVPALGIRYEPSTTTPPSLYTTTKASVTLTLANQPDFVPGPEIGTCTWAIDGGAIEGIGGSVGTLQGRRLSVGIRPGGELEDGSIFFSVEQDDVTYVGLPAWRSMSPITSTDRGQSGSVDFATLPFEPQKPGYEPDASWSRTLTGTLTWTCE